MKGLKLINWILSRGILIFILLTLVFSGYVLWSNQRVYDDAGDVYSQLLQLKPEIEISTEKEAVDFSELHAINPDICGWLTLPGTQIDYPILQGNSNMHYMNRDPYGTFSLAGSIFLDTRSSNTLQDSYSLVYGHHMSDHLMFGDLDLYKDREFFETNRSATIVTEEGLLTMTVLAILEIPDSAEEIFDPALWGKDLTGLANYVQENALLLWDEALDELLRYPTTTQAVGLATCSEGSTGMRTVIILTCRREKENPDRPDPTEPTQPSPTEPPVKPPPKTGDSVLNSPNLWIAVLAASLLLMAVLTTTLVYKRKSKK